MTPTKIQNIVNWGKYGNPDGKVKSDSLWDWACGSCGCRLMEPSEVDDLQISSSGISIYPGKCGKEKKTDKQEVVHVETSAGPLTLNLRYAAF